MYNPYEEFEKSDQPLSTKVTERLGAEAAQSQQTIETMQEAEKQQLAPNGKPVQQKPSQSPTGTPVAKTESSAPKEPVDTAKVVAETALAIPTGAVDFGVDAINLIPGVNVPKIPKFKNDLAQAAREISSFIIPTVFLTRGLGAAGKAAQAKVGWEVGKSAIMKFIGEAGVAAGAGAIVDSTNKIN